MTHTPNIDQWGFINSLDGCRFVSGLHMKDLTIEPPEGGRIGSDYVQKIKHVDELLEALKLARAVIRREKDDLTFDRIEQAIAKAEGKQ